MFSIKNAEIFSFFPLSNEDLLILISKMKKMSIQRYLDQLIEDIDEKMKVPSLAKINKQESENLSFEEEMEMFEKDEGIPVMEYSKIYKENLPPPDQLNIKQVKVLVEKLSQLLAKWNFHLEFPERLPAKKKYKLIYAHWEEFNIPAFDWHFHYDFCSGTCEECEVEKYCETAKQEYYIPDDSVENYELTESEMKINDHDPGSNTDEDLEFKKGKIKHLLNDISDKDFIHSVHNYCDRWCDRCKLSDKCSVFYLENEMLKIANEDQSEIDPFKNLKNTLSLTNELLKDQLKEHEIHVEIPPISKDSLFPEIPEKEQAVLNAAKEYTFSTSEWLKINGGFGLHSKQEISESINVILYYHIFISAKISRAFYGKTLYDDKDKIQNDNNGSAKVALIAIRKSIDSWMLILNMKRESEDSIMQQCIKLKNLQKMLDDFFPYSEEFLRPGFDYIPD